MPNRGRFAAVTDPQGAVLALIKSSTGDPAEREPVLNEWLWNELWAENKDDALKFYMEIFGYKVKEVEALDSSLYHTLHLDEKARAGILEIPIAKVNPHWLTYIAVDDVAETKTKAEELGGAVLVFVEGTKRGAAAIIADPSGAVFGIQKWPIEREDAK
jgi:hypothetical protein